MFSFPQQTMDNQAFESTEIIQEEPAHLKERKISVASVPTAFEDHSDTPVKCQLFGCVKLPQFCQKWFLSAPWVLVFLCWASTMQGMVINGFVNAVISSLEQRFGLKSTETGVIAGSYDIGSMLSVIPITYFGGRVGTSKPKYISLGLLLMGLGSLMFALPHFTTDVYLSDQVEISETSNSTNDLCVPGRILRQETKEELDAAETLIVNLQNYKYFFVFGQILHGVGAAPLITLGTTFLDESVPRLSAPMFIGIFQTFFVVGPALGYLLGGFFLSIYTDIDSGIAIENLTSDSPLWVGAWWMGFLMAFVLTWCCAFFLSCYPSVIPQNPKVETKGNETKTDHVIQSYGTLKEMPKVIWTLLTNATYMMINLGGAADGFTISGLSAFLPKYLQSQYGFSSGFAVMLVGLLVIPAGGLGTFTGGYITKRFKLNRSQVIRMYIYCQMITIPAAFGLLFYCPNANFDQVSTSSTMMQPKDLQKCQESCACSLDFRPICSDETIYFNPCLAGCSSFEEDKYSNCPCLNEDQVGVPGKCDQNCRLLPGLLLAVFVSIWFTFMSAMPNVVATLRSVEPIHRSLALGIESIILRLVGTIPGPIFFGWILDHTCLLTDGNCLFYDNWNMALYMAITVFSVKSLGVGFFGLALYCSHRSPIKDESDETIDLDHIK